MEDSLARSVHSEGHQGDDLPEQWTIWLRVKQRVLFKSSKGHLETLPTALVDLMARGEPLNCEVIERNDSVLFVSDAGKELGRIPKSLAAVLDSQHLLRNWTC